MTKTQYIIKMLDAIKDIFPIGQDFKLLLETNALSDEMIETLLTMLKAVRETITDQAQQQKIDNSLAFMDKLKAIEAEEHTKDEQKIKELETYFTTL
jgi:hypothetical protein